MNASIFFSNQKVENIVRKFNCHFLFPLTVLHSFTIEFQHHQVFPEPAEQTDVPWQY